MRSDLNDVPILATLQEAAQFMRLSERKVWSMGKTGEIRRVLVGQSSVRYALREYVGTKQEEAA